jgi:transposase InsO family protein
VANLPIDVEQDKDLLLSRIKREKQLLPEKWSDYVIKDRVLYRRSDFSPPRLCIPSHLRLGLLNMFHNTSLAGHVGINKMLFNLTQRYYWPDLYSEVANFVNTCPVCLRFKNKQPISQGLLHPISVSFPFEIVCSDIAGPFKQTDRGNKYVLVCMCMFTNWVEIGALKSLEADEVADLIFNLIFLRHGCPTSILTDQGRNYASKLFKLFCSRLGITKLQTTPYHPQGNGKAEVFMKFLVSNLATLGSKDQSNWDLLLPTVSFIHNTTMNDTIQETPFYLLFGRDPILPADIEFGHQAKKFPADEPNRFDYKTQFVSQLRKKYEEIQNVRAGRQAKQKVRFDKKRKPVEFQIGDEVMLYWPMPKKGFSQKLLPKWSGPYRIVRRLGDVTYRIGINDSKTLVVHVQRLKKVEPRMVNLL